MGQSWHAGRNGYSESYTYNTSDGSLATVTTATGETVQLGYDELQRLTSVGTGLYTRTYTYRNQSDTKTTEQVSQVQYTGLPTALSYGYTYDARGNIATYTAPGKGTVTYTYDVQNQLLSAVGDESYTYTYDTGGNILTANGHTYTYGDSDWVDLLTAYDGETITYDQIGNPLSYYNGTRWTFTWENGRSLATATDGTTSISYAYDANGLRTSKAVGDVTHTYLYASGQLLRETYSGMTFDFFYDSNGHAYALKHNGTLYYYITNLQGDVMYMVDAQGNTVASYEYDPYGNVISATGAMAQINPLRYRGYYYDAELGMYYLQSRYYDPVVGRFINADDYASTGIGIIGCNMFSYCRNVPVSNKDSAGTSPISALGLADYAVIHKIVQVLCVAKYDWDMEVYVKNGIKVGYLDLLDTSTMSYYEVKSKDAAKRSSTRNQMKKYDGARIRASRYKNTALYNRTVKRGKKNVSGRFAYGIYDIRYWKKSDGSIVYDITRNSKRTISVAIATVTVLLLATGNVPGAVGLAPLLA